MHECSCILLEVMHASSSIITLSVLRQSSYTLLSMSLDDSKCESPSLHGYATVHADRENGGSTDAMLQNKRRRNLIIKHTSAIGVD